MKYLIIILCFAMSLGFARTNKTCRVTSKQCIDKSTFADKHFVLPEAVVDFDKEGLSFCIKDVAEHKAPAILYIMDQSGSMQWKGDPNSIRGKSVVEAVKNQKEVFPGSAVGYIDFSGKRTTHFETPIKSLDNNFHYNNLINNIRAVNGSGTHYLTALEKAKNYLDMLDNDKYVPYIFFITDGEPDDPIPKILSALKGLPQIHTIFLGEQVSDDIIVSGDSGNTNPDNVTLRQMLNKMAFQTNGTFHHIKTKNTNALADTLESLVDYAIKNTQEKVTAVDIETKNSSISFAIETDLMVKEDEQHWAFFERPIPLGLSENRVDLSLVYKNQSTEEFSFILDVTEGISEENFESDYWDLYCQLRINDTILIVDTLKETKEKTVSTLEIEMEEGTGKSGTADLAIVVGNFESTKLTTTVIIELPNKEDVVVVLEKGQEGGMYEGVEDLFDKLIPYQGEEIDLKVWYVDSWGDTIRTELEISVYKKKDIDVSKVGIELVTVRPIIDYSDVDQTQFNRYEEIADEAEYFSSNFNTYVRQSKKRIHMLNAEGEIINDEISDTDELLGPTFDITVSLPEINGEDEKEYDGTAEWEVTVVVDGWFYNHHGAFIQRLKRKVVVPFESFKSEKEVQLYAEWIPEIEDEVMTLSAINGRQVQSGVILAGVSSTVRCKLMHDYGELEEGYVDVIQKTKMISIGYIRPE